MQYAIKGSNEQWKKALNGKEIDGTGNIQIESVREKRKNVDEDDYEKEGEQEQKLLKTKPKKKKKRR
jgi:hypothetical protein